MTISQNDLYSMKLEQWNYSSGTTFCINNLVLRESGLLNMLFSQAYSIRTFI